MGKNQLIHGNEFHLLKQAEIHKATGKLVESLNLAAGSTGGFDIYKVVEAYFTDLRFPVRILLIPIVPRSLLTLQVKAIAFFYCNIPFSYAIIN